jgi:hypothetical protein
MSLTSIFRAVLTDPDRRRLKAIDRAYIEMMDARAERIDCERALAKARCRETRALAELQEANRG